MNRPRALWDRAIHLIASIGGPVDDPDLRTEKTVLVALSISAIPLGIIWTLIELSTRDIQSAYASALTAALILGNFMLYLASGNFRLFRVSQLAVFITFPLLIHLTGGGFTGSANLFWGLATPLFALLAARPGQGTPWLIVFLLMAVLSGFLEPFIFPEGGLTLEVALFDFSLNIVNISIIVFLMYVYFVRQKNRAYLLLRAEQVQSESLLLNVLPLEVAPQLKAGQRTIAEHYEQASILFADIVDFTRLSSEMAAEEMVDLLNEIFSQFDALVGKYNLEKIRTIGDNYMVASGVPRPRRDHATAIAHLALEMANYVEGLPSQNGRSIDFRIGINSGPVVAGVIGRRKFQYDIWGDAVNLASRMESSGEPGSIQISEATHDLLNGDFECKQRGKVEVKGMGASQPGSYQENTSLERRKPRCMAKVGYSSCTMHGLRVQRIVLSTSQGGNT